MWRLSQWGILLSFTLSSFADYTFQDQNLTDEQQMIANQYINQAYLDDYYKTQCAQTEYQREDLGLKVKKKSTVNLDEDYCTKGKEAQVAKVFGKKGDAIIDLVANMYYQFPMGGELKTKVGKGSSSSGSQSTQKADTTQEKDKCGMIPVFSTNLAKVQQTLTTAGISVDLKKDNQPSLYDVSPEAQNALAAAHNPAGEESYQKQSFIDAAKVHKGRSKAAGLQTLGYAATTACYSGVIASGASVDPKAWIKLGAASFLGIFYGAKIGAHLKYQKALESIASQFPGKGACNPFVDNPETAVNDPQCYCDYPSNIESPYCVAYKKAHGVKPQELKTCMNSKMQEDPQCACVLSNSCIDKVYHDFAAQLPMGENYASVMLKSMDFTRGQNTQNAEANALANLKAANRLITQLGDKLPSYMKNINLNKDQEKLAETLSSMGLATPFARYFASMPASNSSLAKNFADGLNPALLIAADAVKEKPVEIASLNFRGGNGGSRRDSNDSDSTLGKYLSQMNKKPVGSAGSGKDNVIYFANKAAEQADINHKSSQDLFEIITHRYQTWFSREGGI